MGGRGRVGREVLGALSRKGARVRSLVRAPSSGPLLPGVREVVGDLGDRPSLDRALAGVDAAFFVTPHAENEEALGRVFVEAAVAAGVRRVVFASAYHADFRSVLAYRLFAAAMGVVTHYGPKLRVEGHVRRCGASPVVLMPSNFFQNDELFLPELRQGRYPQPLGERGANRVDCRDIGDAAARAMLDPSVAAGAYPLVGPDPALTGPECAAVWASVLGREVRYEGSLGQWRALVADRMQARERDDFGKTYALFGRVRVQAKPEELARTTALLQRPPRAYRDYVAELAARVR